MHENLKNQIFLKIGGCKSGSLKIVGFTYTHANKDSDVLKYLCILIKKSRKFSTCLQNAMTIGEKRRDIPKHNPDRQPKKKKKGS